MSIPPDGLVEELQPLDDKELREKALLTDEEVKFYSRAYTDIHHEHWHYTPRLIAKAQLDKALALLQPKIEEARKQGIRQAIGNLKMHHCKELREKIDKIFNGCYSKDLSACPDHTIFQRGKACNELVGLLCIVDVEARIKEIENG